MYCTYVCIEAAIGRPLEMRYMSLTRNSALAWDTTVLTCNHALFQCYSNEWESVLDYMALHVSIDKCCIISRFITIVMQLICRGRCLFSMSSYITIIVGNFGKIFNLVIWCVVQQVFSKIVMTTITVFMLIECKLIIILNFVQFSGKGHHVLH